MLKKLLFSGIGIALLLVPVFAAAASCPNLTRTLSLGSRDATTAGEVTQLQDFLILQNLLATDSATGYFGRLTQSAVQKFQCNQNLVCFGSRSTTGWGVIGPRTRAAIAASCSVEVPASCTFNNQPIVSGSSVTAYQSFTVPFGSQCVAEQRTCNNGTLSGSHQYAACTNGEAASCAFNGQSVPSGTSVVAYQSSSVPSGQQCVSQQRTCTNGTLTGSYQSSSCVVDSSPPPPPPGRPFSYYFSEQDIPSATGISNTVFVTANYSDTKDYNNSYVLGKVAEAQQRGLRVILVIYDILFNKDLTIRTDAASTFTHLWDALQPYQSRVSGFYLMDEPFGYAWSLRQNQTTTLSDTEWAQNMDWGASYLQSVAPSIPTMIVFSDYDVTLNNFYTQLLPPNLDWVGYDCYLSMGCTQETAFNSLNTLLQSKRLNQRIFIAPDAHWTSAPTATIDAQVAARVRFYERFAAFTSDVAGVFPFALTNSPEWASPGWVGIGSGNLPQTKKELERFFAGLVPLTTWTDGSGNKWTTSHIVPTNYGSEKVVGYAMTHADSTKPSIEIEDCGSDWNGNLNHVDHLLSTRGDCATENYPAGRSNGWIYQSQQSGTSALYRCWNPTGQYHFATTNSSCDGLGQVEKTLGYILTFAPSTLTGASVPSISNTYLANALSALELLLKKFLGQ